MKKKWGNWQKVKTDNISDTLKQDIFSEMGKFKKLLNLVFKTDIEVQIDGSLFSNLSTSLTEECPLLFEVVEHLFLISSGERCRLVEELTVQATLSHYYAVLAVKRLQTISRSYLRSLVYLMGLE